MTGPNNSSFLDLSLVCFVHRSDLSMVILQLKCLGIDNVLRFNFLSPPSARAMMRGLELLYALGGIDDHAKLAQPLGIRMAEFPLNPMFAKMLLVSGLYLLLLLYISGNETKDASKAHLSTVAQKP